MRFFFLCAGIPAEIFEQVRKERTFIGGNSTDVELLPPVGPCGTPYTSQYIGRSLQTIDAKTKLDDKLEVPPAYAVLYLRAGNDASLTVVVKLFVAKRDQLKGVFWALVRTPVCLG